MTIQTECGDALQAASLFQNAAARLLRTAEVCHAVGPRITPGTPNKVVLRGLSEADLLDAITMLVEGGDPLERAIEEVITRGWRPSPGEEEAV